MCRCKLLMQQSHFRSWRVTCFKIIGGMSKHCRESRVSYDADHRIWSAGELNKSYDDELTIGEIIFEQMHKNPERVCQISHSEHTTLTKQQILGNAIKVATMLRDAGFVEGDIVGLIARNTTHLAATVYGCMFNGTPFHAVNVNLEESIVQELYNITKPKVIFCDGQEYEKVKNATYALQPTIYTLSNHIAGVASFEHIMRVALDKKFQPTKLANGIDRTMAILSTSGSTGKPKAVTITNSRKLFEPMHFLTSADVYYVPSTMDWITGLITAVSSAVYDALRIISSNLFSAQEFLQITHRYKVTASIINATHVPLLVHCAETNRENLSSLRHLLFGGGRSKETTLQLLRSFLPSSGVLRNMYGFTEFGAIISLNDNFEEKPNAAGLLTKGIRMKIIDGENNLLGPNGRGELLCYDGQRWNGYYDNQKATEELQDADGWFHSGDVGFFDEDNYLHIVERKKDLLKYLHMKYFPHEIEEVIAKMPEVVEVCVFGVWDELVGDAAAAAVVKHPSSALSAETVIAYVAAHVGAKYKQLNAGALIVNELKKTPNGKINRPAVKAEYMLLKNIKQA